MRKTAWWTALIVLAVAVPSIVVAGTNYEKYDKGPQTINVSKYPKEMQEIYKDVFSHRCKKCHSLGRPINISKTPAEWEKYVHKMEHKPNSGISKLDAAKIIKFLIYDQKERKDKEKK